MNAKDWIKGAESQGWRVSRIKSLTIEIRCSKQGCEGCKVLPMDNLGAVPEPCNLPHVGKYAAKTFDQYLKVVDELRRRRRSLGLSQEDVTAASGLTDGYINKLEAIARPASVATLQLWAQTLGLSLTFAPSPLPPSTIRAIESRTAAPYQPAKANFKPQQKELFRE